MPSTSVQAVELPPTERSVALVLRNRVPITPYKPDAWERALQSHGLLNRFHNIPEGLRTGFKLDFPPISHVQSPPNKDSVVAYSEELHKTVHKEISKQRYIGPLSLPSIESLIGPFQSSPLSIVPKPGRPGKYRLVQNFSFPLNPSPAFPNHSINSCIEAENFPSTWGKFSVVYLLISRLPPGSEAATRDVAEAYRTIPLHPSQWPAAVVRISDTEGCIDTCTAFGATPSAGGYGHLADGGAEIARARGIGPLDKWVDDHLFIRIPRSFLSEYNAMRLQWNHEIAPLGMRQTGSRIWYGGKELHDGNLEEFSEDCSRPLIDLSHSSPRNPHDQQFSYNLDDVDHLSEELGIPWETTKDQPFDASTIYIGFVWDIQARTVSLSPTKVAKYLQAIQTWQERRTHVLQDVRELYGKLLHASSALRRGRAYLTSLERMLSICASHPFMPHRPDKHVAADLIWWTDRLQAGEVSRPIKPPPSFLDLQAFSDASSGIGIGIVVDNRWRAWRLIPGWQTARGAKRDIGWAEAAGFELLVHALDKLTQPDSHVIAYGDNMGVVEGWWTGRHRNTEVNSVFKRIHNLLLISPRIAAIHTEYVPSKDNPADGPSRGIYPPQQLLLPRIPIPAPLLPFIVDAADDLTPTELRLQREGAYTRPANKIIDRVRVRQEAFNRSTAIAREEEDAIHHILLNP